MKAKKTLLPKLMTGPLDAWPAGHIDEACFLVGMFSRGPILHDWRDADATERTVILALIARGILIYDRMNDDIAVIELTRKVRTAGGVR